MSYTAGQKLRASQMSVYVCTSATHPAGHTGQLIYETDTGLYAWYDGSAWRSFVATGVTNHEAEYYLSGTQTIPTATDRPVGFDTSVITASDVTQGTSTAGSIANAKFTLNRAGIWSIDAAIRWATTSSGNRYGLWIGPDNGTTRYGEQFSIPNGTAAFTPSAGFTKRFVAGDTIVVNAFQDSGSNKDVAVVNQGTHIHLTWMRP